MSERLTRLQIQTAAHTYGIEPASLRAVIQVEAGSSGFLPNGWVKILFERHWLWRRLEERGISPKPLAASRPDLCGRTWGRRYYRGGTQEWDRVAAVISWGQRNDASRWESYKKAAYESCSWGLGQLMGFHYARLGCENVYEFKHLNEESEAKQLELMIRFLQTAGLMDELKERRWSSFARTYNGTGQVTFYAGRLQMAYMTAKMQGWNRV